ncbi:MAG: response regulator [Comamonadaceae bacterium]|nr:response regulator [Comamonadaceae bacterium]
MTQPLPVVEVASPSATVTRRVLVVDDDVDAGEGLASLLALEGLSVRVKRDGQAALAEASTWMPDAAVVDLHMPGMDGHELCRVAAPCAGARGAVHHRRQRLRPAARDRCRAGRRRRLPPDQARRCAADRGARASGRPAAPQALQAPPASGPSPASCEVSRGSFAAARDVRWAA